MPGTHFNQGSTAKAVDNYELAKHLLQLRKYNATANRAWFALFQAAACQLLAVGEEPWIDRKGKKVFHHESVLTWLKGEKPVLVADQRNRRFCAKLFGLRIKGDYYPDNVESTEMTKADLDRLGEILKELKTPGVR